MKLKNLLYLLLIPTLSLSLISCDDDKDESDSSIIGTWKLEKFHSPYVESNNTALTQAITQHIKDSVIDQNNDNLPYVEIAFNLDSTFKKAIYIPQIGVTDTLISTGRYTYKDHTITIYQECIEYINKTDYKRGYAQLRSIESSLEEDPDGYSLEINLKNNIYYRTQTLLVFYASEFKLARIIYKELLSAYPEIMKPLANLTEKEIEELEVYKAEISTTYKKQ